MSIYTRVFYPMTGILFIAALTSCGGDKSKSEKAKLSIIPEKPIVITGDAVDDNDTAIKAPWFSFRASMTNESAYTVTIVALEVEVTGQNESGSSVTSTVAFTPSQFNSSFEKPDGNGATVTIECKYKYFAELAPGTGGGFRLMGAVSDCGTPIPTFYVGNNPKGREGSNNYRYTLRLKPLGWFGTYLLPTDRYERTQTFYTQ
jgi:hypothetical protein